MKNPNRTLLLVAALLVVGYPSLRADDSVPGTPPPPPPGEKGEHRHERREEMRENLEKMAKELNLTPEQKTQIEGIRKQARESIKTVRSDSTLTEDQKRAKGREIMKSAGDQERAVLTPEQQAKAKEFHEKNGHHGGPGEGTPPPPPPST